MKLRDTNIIDYDNQVVELDDLRFDAAGKFWYDHQDHEIGPGQMLSYAMKLEQHNRKLEALQNYAQHRVGCGYWDSPSPECDCGLVELLAALEDK